MPGARPHCRPQFQSFSFVNDYRHFSPIVNAETIIEYVREGELPALPFSVGRVFSRFAKEMSENANS